MTHVGHTTRASHEGTFLGLPSSLLLAVGQESYEQVHGSSMRLSCQACCSVLATLSKAITLSEAITLSKSITQYGSISGMFHMVFRGYGGAVRH